MASLGAVLNSYGFLREDDVHFYTDTLYKWVDESDVSVTPGADLARKLHAEVQRARDEAEPLEYYGVVSGMYKAVIDSMMSAVHRSAAHTASNRGNMSSAARMAKDEEELMLTNGIFDSDDDDEDDEVDSTASSSVGRQPVKDPQEQKQKKREEQRRRRTEEETMLVQQKKVRDDKGNLLSSIGPFPPPRIAVRGNASNVYLSRKALQQRTVVYVPEEKSDSDVAPRSAAEALAASQLTSSQPDGQTAVDHLSLFLSPLSTDSLKKVSESAKVKLLPSASNSEFVSQIVKTAVRFGCEKACVLMDKHKMIEEVTTHVQTGPLPTAASIEFLNSLPEDLKCALGPVLGLSEEHPRVEDMWERMVAMGFLAVLTNLRLKPLRKIASELRVPLPETNSTEKFCEAIVFSAFPRERTRAKNSLSRRQKVVTFAVPQSEMRCVGDMGFIIFHVQNVSALLRDSDRHYTPEFEYGNLKWSLLCMANNKDSLALYLCQTGTVYCKFLITIVNSLYPDESICNEGTQRFSTSSQENDWGFNNVIKFDDLLNPERGFYHKDGDYIVVEVGIVMVEAPKPAPVARSNPAKEKHTMPKVDEKAVLQLIEDEQAQVMRKKLRQEINKTGKDEERTRKDIQQKALKTIQDLMQRCKTERTKLEKDEQVRERREQQERIREEEKIRSMQLHNAELRRKVDEGTLECKELAREKEDLTTGIKAMKKSVEAVRSELESVESQLTAMKLEVEQQQSNVAAAEQRLAEAKAAEPKTPTPSEDDNDFSVEDTEMMRQVRESLVGILGE